MSVASVLDIDPKYQLKWISHWIFW
jgi:hypothetical protein